MTIIRDKLLELGFTIESSNSNEVVFNYHKSVEWDGSYNVWITSYNNWYFKIESSKSGAASGCEGYRRYTSFYGHISSLSALSDLDVLLRCTGAIYIIQTNTNETSKP